MYRKNPKLLNQFQYSEKEGIPFMVLVGEEEKANGGVKIRDVDTRKEVSERMLMWLWISEGQSSPTSTENDYGWMALEDIVF